ncbi:MBL fold metallo-hydrolase [Methylobacterium sp. Leaf94]|uniref:MBL fold metallo-hydrolase n=1 Tax=Methylobacterium sp. Leaf94 TaxID=1736250 RepID=UPI00138EE2A7|nr:MBL fold metallo-hydrolase [Methylobacterium sp. Leaf94]
MSDVFVSHAHMDHFAGFDRLLRVCLHRPQPLHLVGPAGFIKRVAHRLHAYKWNLLGEHSPDFRITVDEFTHGHVSAAAEFRARDAFRERRIEPPALGLGLVLIEERFRVEAAVLDHGIPSLAFALVEPIRVSVWQGALDQLGFAPGPWLREAKLATLRKMPGETRIPVAPDISLSLAELQEQVLRIGPGQKIAYVTDAADTPDNAEHICRLALRADEFFIEAVFLEADREVAERTRHLTAHRAATLARDAEVRRAVLFHHSARYMDQPNALATEFQVAFESQ